MRDCIGCTAGLPNLVHERIILNCLRRRWEEGNVSEWSTVTYPDGLLEWAEAQFSKMKERQAKLLGIKPDNGHALALPAPLSKL